jgi:phage/conjugal plasmid C-4 type zinc finger TraR family protein
MAKRMDEADWGEKNDAFYRRLAIDQARSDMAADVPSNEFCEDCGRRIPDRRRAAVPGCTLCVRCQAAYESQR